MVLEQAKRKYVKFKAINTCHDKKKILRYVTYLSRLLVPLDYVSTGMLLEQERVKCAKIDGNKHLS